METLNIHEITAHYRALDAKVPLRPIRNRKDYARAVSAMNALLDAGAADESHPLAGLAATLGELARSARWPGGSVSLPMRFYSASTTHHSTTG